MKLGYVMHFQQLIAACAVLVLAGPGSGQLVINAPPEVIGNSFTLNDGEILNVSQGGMVGDALNANSGSQVNIGGGIVGSALAANAGSEVNVSGGSVGSINASASAINISGGSVLGGIDAAAGALVDIGGGDIGGDVTVSSGGAVSLTGGTLSGKLLVPGGTASVDGQSVVRQVEAFSGGVATIGGASRVDLARGTSTGDLSINGGTVGVLRGFSGSTIPVSGGAIVRVDIEPDAELRLVGNEFRLNGEPFAGATADLELFDVLSGTLADGSAIVLGQLAQDELSAVTLSHVAVPEADPMPRVTSTPLLGGPFGLRAGQTLTLSQGSVVGDGFAVVSGALRIDGGSVGEALEVSEGVVSMTRGTVGRNATAFPDSVVDLFGGTVGEFFRAVGADVNIHGGDVGGFFSALEGSKVSLSGGTIGQQFEVSDSSIAITGGEVRDRLRSFGSDIDVRGGRVGNLTASAGSTVTVSGGNTNSLRVGEASRAVISGGAFGRLSNAPFDGRIELIGGDFQLNGVPYIESSIDLNFQNLDDIFTGTLADGSAFLFSRARQDEFSRVTLTRTALPEADVAPRVVTTTLGDGPYGLRAGQTTILREGGALPDNFAVIDAILHIEAGTVGDGLEVVGSDVFITGGEVGERYEALSGTTTHISGGSVGRSFAASAGTVVNLTGGSLGAFATAKPGSVLNMSGGQLGSHFDAEPESVINIQGGIVGDDFDAFEGSEVNLVGLKFRLDGVPVDGLEIGQPVTIDARGATLDGLLADGSPFGFDLGLFVNSFEDFFSADALLTVTLVESGIPGDYNNDGTVDAGDYTVWRDNVNAPPGLLLNDIDGGVVGSAQYDTWRSNFGMTQASTASTAVVPEPISLLLVLAMIGLASSQMQRT